MWAKTMESARVIPVIETKIIRGAGTEKDPVHFVTQYWDLRGNLLAETDGVKPQEESALNFVQTASMEQLIHTIKELGVMEK